MDILRFRRRSELWHQPHTQSPSANTENCVVRVQSNSYIQGLINCLRGRLARLRTDCDPASGSTVASHADRPKRGLRHALPVRLSSPARRRSAWAFAVSAGQNLVPVAFAPVRDAIAVSTRDVENLSKRTVSLRGTLPPTSGLFRSTLTGLRQPMHPSAPRRRSTGKPITARQGRQSMPDAPDGYRLDQP